MVPAVLLVANCYLFWVLTHGRGLRIRGIWTAGDGSRARPDVAVGVVALFLVPPAALFAADMVAGFREGRPPLDDDTWGIDHWPTQAALALAVAAIWS